MKMLKKQQSNLKTTGENKKESIGFYFPIMAIMLIIVFSIALTPVTLQNDTFYTIKIGEYITQNGIDGMDPFSWHEDLAYTYPHWLYDLITYFIYAGFGMQGIYIVTCILSCVLGVSLYIVNKKLVKNEVTSFFITIGVIYILNPYIAARAQLVTFILFIWTIYFIEMFLNTKKIKYAIPLIIIPILIANLHVAVWPFYFVLYLPYIAEYLIALQSDILIYQKRSMILMKKKIDKLDKKENLTPEELQKLEKLKLNYKEKSERIEKIKIKREQEKNKPYKLEIEKNSNVKWLIVIMIVCVLTGLFTPIGTTPYTYLYKTMTGNTTQHINEHLPMTLINETEVLCIFIMLLALLVFSKAKIRLNDLFMLGGLVFLMLASKRQVTMLVIVGSIIMNRLIISACKEHKIDFSRFKEIFQKPIPAIILISIIVFTSVYFYKPKMDDDYINVNDYPVAACDFIINNVDLANAKFYNEYNYGSYMLFRGIPVFIDSRADLYDPEFSGLEDDIFMDFINTSGISTFYGDIFEKYGITHVITYKNSKMNMIITKTLDPTLTQIYGDDNFVVYQRVVDSI